MPACSCVTYCGAQPATANKAARGTVALRMRLSLCIDYLRQLMSSSRASPGFLAAAIPVAGKPYE
jgi:hypothetical protein